MNKCYLERLLSTLKTSLAQNIIKIAKKTKRVNNLVVPLEQSNRKSFQLNLSTKQL